MKGADPSQVAGLMDSAAYQGLHRRAGEGRLGLMPIPTEEFIRAEGNARRNRRVRSVEELFSSIPEALRLKAPLRLLGPLSEAELIRFFRDRAAENSLGYTSFLGAGVYNHLRSVVTDTILLRGEFLTSYTPYQAEISQGTLQAIFEFQTLMCQLTGQEVANASMWDGSTATTEAVLMADRLMNRRRVLVARSLHPEYRAVLATYASNLGLGIRRDRLHGIRADRHGSPGRRDR